MSVLDPEHVETQRSIANGLFETYAKKSTAGTTPADRETFVEIVAPWVVYDGAPNDPKSGYQTLVEQVEEVLILLRPIYAKVLAAQARAAELEEIRI